MRHYSDKYGFCARMLRLNSQSAGRLFCTQAYKTAVPVSVDSKSRGPFAELCIVGIEHVTTLTYTHSMDPETVKVGWGLELEADLP